MHFFTNCQIEIYEPIDNEVCCYTGEPTEKWVKIATVDADFQNVRANDSQTDSGLFLEDTYKIYIDLNVPVSPKSRIKVVGHPNWTYEVIGSPKRYNMWLDYTKIEVQKQRYNTIKNE